MSAVRTLAWATFWTQAVLLTAFAVWVSGVWWGRYRVVWVKTS